MEPSEYIRKNIKLDKIAVSITQFLNFKDEISNESLNAVLPYSGGSWKMTRVINKKKITISISKNSNNNNLQFRFFYRLNFHAILKNYYGIKDNRKATDGKKNYIPMEYRNQISLSEFTNSVFPEMLIKKCQYRLQLVSSILKLFFKNKLKVEPIIPAPNEQSFTFNEIELCLDHPVEVGLDPCTNDQFYWNWNSLVKKTIEKDFLDQTHDSHLTIKDYSVQKVNDDCSIKYLAGPVYKGMHFSRVYIKDKNYKDYSQLRCELVINEHRLKRIVGACSFERDKDVRAILKKLYPFGEEYLSNILGYTRIPAIPASSILIIARELISSWKTPKDNPLRESQINEIINALDANSFKLKITVLSSVCRHHIRAHPEHFVKVGKGTYSLNWASIAMAKEN